MKVGVDIHPNHRRKGYATLAYKRLFGLLVDQGLRKAWLEVLTNNHAAIHLYNKLGFVEERRASRAVLRSGVWRDSIVMSLALKPAQGRNAKVIALYLGERRAPPTTSQEAVRLLRWLLEKEKSTDPGCATDTLIVHNRCEPSENPQAMPWLQEGERLLAEADGQDTTRGTIKVVERENIGISFGAFNHGFAMWGEHYDYWLFTEDDQVMVRDGYFQRAIRQIEEDPRIGFVAIVGVSKNPRLPPHAHGGVGVAPQLVLNRVRAANPSRIHAEGHLPYHLAKGYRKHIALGEIRFTNAIQRLGYRLVDLEEQDVCVSWGRKGRRTPRMKPWEDPNHIR